MTSISHSRSEQGDYQHEPRPPSIRMGIEVVKRVNKAELIAFRLTTEDRQYVKRASAKLKISESDLIRRAILLYKDHVGSGDSNPARRRV
jgi:hypothetical protein